MRSLVPCQTAAAISSATRSRKTTSSTGMVDGTAPTDVGRAAELARRARERALAGCLEFVVGVVMVLEPSEDEFRGCAGN
jgi:hypothetical protein